MDTARGSLAFGVPDAAPGTIHALTISATCTAGPEEGRQIVFGRNVDDVNLCIGGYDRSISRKHGVLARRSGHWWLSNIGKRPMRLPGNRTLVPADEPVLLDTGYTPLFVLGSGAREHLLELYVTSSDTSRSRMCFTAETTPPRVWKLLPIERLTLIVLAQRYLLQESYPQPMAWGQAAAHLRELRPDDEWNAKKVEHLVCQVRARLSAAGVAGLTRAEVGEPVGNMLNHNLIRELIDGTTLVPPDLRLIGLRD